MTCMVLVRFVCNSGVFEDMVYLFGVTLWRYIYIYIYISDWVCCCRASKIDHGRNAQKI